MKINTEIFRNTWVEKHIALLVVAFLTMIFLQAYLFYMRISHPEAPYMDTLRLLTYFDEIEQGRRSIWSTWNQGSHRGISSQLLVYLNAKFFGLNIYIATLLSGIVIAISSIVICTEILRSLSEFKYLRTKKALTIASILIFISLFTMFSLSNWELYFVDVGVILFAKNLFFVIYWIGLDRVFRRGCPSKVVRIGLLIGGPVLILLFALGWSYAFVTTSIACLFLLRPAGGTQADKRYWILLLSSLVLSMALYIAGGYVIPTELAAYSPGRFAASITNTIEGFFLALSTILMGTESISRYNLPIALQIFSGALLAVLAMLSLFWYMLSKHRVSVIPFALIVYGALTACALAISRGRFAPELAMASRYFMDLSLLLIGICWTFVLFYNRSIGERRIHICAKLITSFAALTMLSMFFVGQSITTLDEWRAAPYRHAHFLKMRDVTLSGVLSDSDAALLQQPMVTAARGVDIQRRYSLGPFHKLGCSLQDGGATRQGWYAREGATNAAWVSSYSSMLIKNCGGDLLVSAYIPKNFESRSISVQINGVNNQSFIVTPGQQIMASFPINSDANILHVDIYVDKVTRPYTLSSTVQDDRDLGAFILQVSTKIINNP